MQTKVLLVAVNAGYIHSSFSLRCLLANMGELANETHILETDGEASPVQLCEQILAFKPSVVGFSVYIWNTTYVISVLRLLKRLSPQIRLVVGGPQVVPEDTATAELFELADCAVVREAEGCVEEVLRNLLDNNVSQTFLSVGTGRNACDTLENIQLPYSLYSDDDIKHRVIYAETSRGCPFQCVYCTSAGQGPIRFFPQESLFKELETLIQRGARKFKFLDRSFNHNGNEGLAVFDFFLRQKQSFPHDLFQLHFEFTPFPLLDDWKKRLCLFQPGELHLEVGIQTWNMEVAKRIQRPMNPTTAQESLHFLIHEAKADVHADLILGLPGETLESAVEGFNRLVSLRPAEIQVGILKNLPGTHLEQRFAEFDLCFSPDPPYEILSTSTLSFETLCLFKRFARCWDMVYNHHRFPNCISLLLKNSASPFNDIMTLSNTIYAEHQRMYALSPKQIAKALYSLYPMDEMKVALETDARITQRIQRF